jgi:DNA-binding NarL/FixJ family response regulator
MSGLRVVLADDHPVVRAGLRALLDTLPDVEVVGVAADGREAVREVVVRRPDVAVLDLQMPEMDGLAAIREIERSAPDTAVLVLTMFDDEDSLFAAMRGAEQDEIHRAIRAVAAGEAIFSPGVAHRVLRYFAAPPPVAEPFPELTPREREILDLLAAALSSIFAKLQVADRAMAILRAREAGLGGTAD